MTGIFSTLLRGLLGVAASVLVVALVWTLYIQRDQLWAMTEPVVQWAVGGDDSEAPASQPEGKAAEPASATTAQ